METVPAELITGEAGTCGGVAMLLVIMVAHANPTMYGHDADPPAIAVLLSALSPAIPNVGFVNAFSEADLSDPRVAAIVSQRGPPLTIGCRGDSRLYFYPKMSGRPTNGVSAHAIRRGIARFGHDNPPGQRQSRYPFGSGRFSPSNHGDGQGLRLPRPERHEHSPY